MKKNKLSIFNKFIYFLNVIVAVLLLLACLSPHISARTFPFFTFLSLSIPFILAINVVFVVYWVLGMKRQFWLSLLVLVIAYFSLDAIYKFSTPTINASAANLKVMSYNVRIFNEYKELENDHVFEDIKALVDEEQPDIICFQETGHQRRKEYKKDYPYTFLKYIYMNNKALLGFHSKYPIVKADLITLPETHNNAAYADILIKNDTVRVYSIHLESLGIDRKTYAQNSKDDAYTKLATSFIKQAEQAAIIAEHYKFSPYKKIICGDFNNSQFSNAYKTIKGNMNDTYTEAGTGFGRTYVFRKLLPMRIDFILADPEFKVISHKNFDEELSDHYPVVATFKF